MVCTTTGIVTDCIHLFIQGGLFRDLLTACTKLMNCLVGLNTLMELPVSEPGEYDRRVFSFVSTSNPVNPRLLPLLVAA